MGKPSDHMGEEGYRKAEGGGMPPEDREPGSLIEIVEAGERFMAGLAGAVRREPMFSVCVAFILGSMFGCAGA